MGLRDRLRRWLSREEQRAIAADERRHEFDETTDRVFGEQPHMTDRISEDE